MTHDVSVIRLYNLDVLGRPVTAIPERGNVDFIEEIRLAVAGTAGGTVVDTALRFAQALGALVVSGLGSDAGINSFEDTRTAMETLPIKAS